MPIIIDPKLDGRLREQEEAQGISLRAPIERLNNAEQSAKDELDSLALEGLNSGDPVELGPGFWDKKHLHLDESLRGSR